MLSFWSNQAEIWLITILFKIIYVLYFSYADISSSQGTFYYSAFDIVKREVVVKNTTRVVSEMTDRWGLIIAD